MPQASEVVDRIFVYGTLKREQCRQHMWPRRPRLVQAAYVQGELYDLGPYPALVPGHDFIMGEVWQFAHEDVDVTLAVLDAIEGFGQGAPDLYRRCVVPCWHFEGSEVTAQTYIYCDTTRLSTKQRILPGSDGYCRWPCHSMDA